MIVPSLPFLIFAAVAALVFNLRPAAWWRQSVLLAVNIAFLASFSRDPTAFLPLAGFIGFGFLASRAVRGSGMWVFVILTAATMTFFFWLKRYGFVPPALFLPFTYVLVGLSYVFFRVLHVVIDSHLGEIDEPVGLLSYLNYTLNFTSLIAGPIQQYQDYRRCETQPAPLDVAAAGVAVERIVVGYFKVGVVSVLLRVFQHHAIEALGVAHAFGERLEWGVLVAAIYPIYLYFNFSGYVDVVIGVARFFGIVLPENFNRPFSSENFIGFWSRWHITLSNWLKTYVYTPLMMAGMRRRSLRRFAAYIAVFAFFVTFFLVGLWHGQTSEFLFFGFLQGGGVAANKLYQIQMQQRLGGKAYQMLAANPLYRAGARGLTFTWFAFTLFWFWSDWGHIAGFARSLGLAGLVAVWLTIFVAAALVLAGLGAARSLLDNRVSTQSRGMRASWSTALAVVTVVLAMLLDLPAPDVVYRAF